MTFGTWRARPAVVSCGLEITGMVFPRVPAHKATPGAEPMGCGDSEGRRCFIGRDVRGGFSDLGDGLLGRGRSKVGRSSVRGCEAEKI